MTHLPTPIVCRRLALLLCALLSACAHRPPPPEPAGQLLHDELYAAPREPIDSAGIFRLSDAMRAYADAELNAYGGVHDPRRALLEALYTRGKLRLSYDAGSTRNAAQAFEARAGNCLSLVIMTAAFAKHLDLPVSYQSVEVDESYTRFNNLMLISGHVNLVLERLSARLPIGQHANEELTVDFLPSEELRGQRAQPLPESTVVAMFDNNRAAEALAEGRLDEGYAWARAAVLQEPGYLSAINTLSVIYLRSGHAAQAERALRHILTQQPDHTGALSNLVLALQQQGREPEAAAVQARLAQIQPLAPFHDFDLGRMAMDAGDYRRARELFARELRRQPYQSEVHFWAALADWRLGDTTRAAQHLQLAADNSTTRSNHDLYTAKLERLRALNVQ